MALLKDQSGNGKLPLILGLVNTLAVLAVLGTMVYTRVIYKRPKITEEQERVEVAEKVAQPAAPTSKALIKFDPFSVNIKSAEQAPASTKLHYVNLGFSIEIRDADQEERAASLKPKFMDHIIKLIGGMTLEDLNTVQGRYILKTKIVGLMNALVNEGQKKAEPLATNVYFTEFMVQ